MTQELLIPFLGRIIITLLYIVISKNPFWLNFLLERKMNNVNIFNALKFITKSLVIMFNFVLESCLHNYGTPCITFFFVIPDGNKLWHVTRVNYKAFFIDGIVMKFTKVRWKTVVSAAKSRVYESDLNFFSKVALMVQISLSEISCTCVELMRHSYELIFFENWFSSIIQDLSLSYILY